MGSLVVSVLTSLDGRYRGPGGDLSVLPFEDAFNDHNLKLLREADTMVYGATWFRQNLGTWAAIAADPTAADRDRAIADQVLRVENVVVSDGVELSDADPRFDATWVVSRAGAVDEVRRRKARGERMLMFGSSTTWRPFLEAGLVDELFVLVGAGLAGAGTALWDGPAVQGLTLLNATVLPGSQIVALHYDCTAPRFPASPTASSGAIG